MTDGTGVYISMRRDGSQPEAHLACFGASRVSCFGGGVFARPISRRTDVATK